MNSEIVKQMRAEEADLVRKLEAVRKFLSAYGEAPSGERDKAMPDRKRASGSRRSRKKVGITSFTEQTRTSVLLALEALVHSTGLLRTKELVEYVERRGHEISGDNKVNALGALLARSEDIQSHGKSGWSAADRDRALLLLQEHLHKENEPSSENAAGSDAVSKSAPPLELTEAHSNWGAEA